MHVTYTKTLPAEVFISSQARSVLKPIFSISQGGEKPIRKFPTLALAMDLPGFRLPNPKAFKGWLWRSGKRHACRWNAALAKILFLSCCLFASCQVLSVFESTPRSWGSGPVGACGQTICLGLVPEAMQDVPSKYFATKRSKEVSKVSRLIEGPGHFKEKISAQYIQTTGPQPQLWSPEKLQLEVSWSHLLEESSISHQDHPASGHRHNWKCPWRLRLVKGTIERYTPIQLTSAHIKDIEHSLSVSNV